MNLKEITQRIQESQSMAASDPEQALKLNRALFLDIARQDELYLVPEARVSEEALAQKLFRPYIAPVQENDPRLFLRVFSHRDAAASFTERINLDQVCQIDGVEMMQLAKTYFLRGVYGFLLNDGLAWAALSFPDFLNDCFRDILGDPSLARPEFIMQVQFINMVRQNQFYHIQIGRQDTVDANRPMRAVLTDQPHGIWFDTPGDWLYEECTLNHLAQVSDWGPESIIRIKTSKIDLQTSPDLLRAALCAAGASNPEDTRYDLDFHTGSIALDYQVRDFDLARLPLRVQLAELPKPEDPEPAADKEPEATEGAEKKTRKFPFAFWRWKRRSAPPPPPVPESEDVLDLPPEQKEQEKPEPQKSEKRRSFHMPSGKTMIRMFFLAALIIIIAAVLAQIFKTSPDDELKKAVQDGSYTEVASMYDDAVKRNPGSQEELLQYMAEDLQAKLDAYAADEITANQLAETIAAYEKIRAMSAKCDAVYDQAAALEQSKLIYQQGLLETSMSARLSVWQEVIAEDTGSQRAMRTSLDENAELYKASVYAETAGMEVGDALSALNTLQSYYPNDSGIAQHIKEWLDTVSKPSPNPSLSGSSIDSGDIWPIAVQGITITTTEDAKGQFDLRIRWTNTSGREIERVLFSVTPLGESGEPVYTSDGSYSEYMAIAQGPYEDGYVMPDTVYWPAAWANETMGFIPAARLNSVHVWYSDGESWISRGTTLY